MESDKVIRSICYFTNALNTRIVKKVDDFANRLELHGYTIQTKRICSKGKSVKAMDSAFEDQSYYLSVGTLDSASVYQQLDDFIEAKNVALNLNLSESVKKEDVTLLYKIIQQRPGKTFDFAYTFHNQPSSPFFPSATYLKDGFSIGLQPTNLSKDCKTIDAWLQKVKSVWNEICEIFIHEPDFLGIDSSIAPLFTGKSSLIHFIKKIYASFSKSVTKDGYLKITRFIKEENPKPIGLCGIMFPCLEDFELTAEYENGNFSIERNIYLSLHSGLTIDTYPIGIDESSESVFEILALLQGLSRKYKKPLSARFVSDGKAKIGDRTNFKNPYLKDVVLKAL